MTQFQYQLRQLQSKTWGSCTCVPYFLSMRRFELTSVRHGVCRRLWYCDGWRSKIVHQDWNFTWQKNYRNSQRGGVKVKLCSFINLGARWCGCSTLGPGRFTPGKDLVLVLYRRLGGPQGRSGWVRKTSPPPGFDLRTANPVASRSTDWAILV
jgi:hypothetical protein